LGKLRIIILLLFCLLIGSGNNSVNASSGISIYINDEKQWFSHQALIEHGVTLVPLRGIFEELGAEVTWNRENKTVYASKGNVSIALKIGSTNAKINGNTVTLSVPAQANSGQTLVPLRFISESLGANVQWDPISQRITITEDLNIVTEDSYIITEQSSNKETQKPKSPKTEKKEQPILSLGETFADEQIEVTVKDIEYVHRINKGFKVYLSVTNKSTKPLQQPGGLQFKLNNALYEDEVNMSGYSHHFESNGYIYPGETRDGYYQWLFDKDVKIEEIEFYMMENGFLKQFKAKWQGEGKNDHTLLENEKVDNNIEAKPENIQFEPNIGSKPENTQFEPNIGPKPENTQFEHSIEPKPGNTQFWNSAEDKTYPIQQGASLAEVENFLTQYYSSITTPMGSLNLSYHLMYFDGSLDMYTVYTKYGDYVRSFLYTIDRYQRGDTKDLYIDENKLMETISILKNFQKEIYAVMEYVYPNKKIQGSFHDSWYRYPNLRMDLVTRSNYEWQNYKFADWDGYNFNYTMGFYFLEE